MSTGSLTIVRLRNRISEIGHVRDELTRFAECASIPNAILHDVLVVADELLSNAIRYGCDDDREHHLEVHAMVADGNLVLRFVDDGRPFDPLGAQRPDLDRPIEERPIGGLGIHLVCALTDTQHYLREKGRNVLVLTRSLTAHQLT